MPLPLRSLYLRVLIDADRGQFAVGLGESHNGNDQVVFLDALGGDTGFEVRDAAELAGHLRRPRLCADAQGLCDLDLVSRLESAE